MRASRNCPVPGCGAITLGGRCTKHKRQADKARGTAHQRGYDNQHRTFRTAVLRRDPNCTDLSGCHQPSTEADHWPLSKRELRAQGMDDHDPRHGRGLCKHHHDQHTARTTPGGWHANNLH